MQIINIRKNIFETNSSSTHCITISNEINDLYDIVNLDENDNFKIHLDVDFGWEKEYYMDYHTKCSYMGIYATSIYPDLQSIFIKCIKDYTYCNNVIFIGKPGYIDHQSIEDKDYHYLFNDEKLLKNFLFNRNSRLITGNDNGDPVNFDDLNYKRFKSNGNIDNSKYIFNCLDLNICDVTFYRKPDSQLILSYLNEVDKTFTVDNKYLYDVDIEKNQLIFYNSSMLNFSNLNKLNIDTELKKLTKYNMIKKPGDHNTFINYTIDKI